MRNLFTSVAKNVGGMVSPFAQGVKKAALGFYRGFQAQEPGMSAKMAPAYAAAPAARR